ncbi:putative ABC transporter permease [Treponema zioleckii]|uniref:putative ABC transporter permease n=1 Tax=Treponema zioleckii TaxID=331680 RepID=UPI00168B17DB|nr:putative ABC transporter permease [Treponema zioleckii]
MTLPLVLAFLFFGGSLIGWSLELIWRRFFSGNNPERKWINPGFLVGPYLPLYGFSLCVLCMMSFIDVSFIENPVLQKSILFVIMALVITLIEYIAGLIFIHGMKIKLWDYSSCWGNIQGIICPMYSFFWWILSGLYYFLIHPHILDSLYWLAEHLSFSFFIGFFYGVFAIDLCYSLKILAKIRVFAKEKDVIVRIEVFKESIRKKNAELKEKRHFVLAFKSEQISFIEQLRMHLEKLKNENKNQEI